MKRTAGKVLSVVVTPSPLEGHVGVESRLTFWGSVGCRGVLHGRYDT